LQKFLLILHDYFIYVITLWRIGLINYNCDKEHYYYYYGESADREPKWGRLPDVQGHSELRRLRDGMLNGGMPNGENDVGLLLRAECRTSLGVMPNGRNAKRPNAEN